MVMSWSSGEALLCLTWCRHNGTWMNPVKALNSRWWLDPIGLSLLCFASASSLLAQLWCSLGLSQLYQRNLLPLVLCHQSHGELDSMFVHIDLVNRCCELPKVPLFLPILLTKTFQQHQLRKSERLNSEPTWNNIDFNSLHHWRSLPIRSSPTPP